MNFRYGAIIFWNVKPIITGHKIYIRVVYIYMYIGTYIKIKWKNMISRLHSYSSGINWRMFQHYTGRLTLSSYSSVRGLFCSVTVMIRIWIRSTRGFLNDGASDCPQSNRTKKLRSSQLQKYADEARWKMQPFESFERHQCLSHKGKGAKNNTISWC